MGVAAEARVRRASMTALRMEMFRLGQCSDNPNAAGLGPTPRHENWGKPTVERARVEAEKIAARNLEKPESALDKAWAVHFVMERAKCGKSTAEEAVKLAGI